MARPRKSDPGQAGNALSPEFSNRIGLLAGEWHGCMGTAEYPHVMFGLVFVKHTSHTSQASGEGC